MALLDYFRKELPASPPPPRSRGRDGGRGDSPRSLGWGFAALVAISLAVLLGPFVVKFVVGYMLSRSMP